VTKRKPEKAKLVWGKGPRQEVIEIAGAKLTIRGLSYREFRYIAGLKTYAADVMTIRLGLTNAENLLAYKKGESGETEEIKITYSNMDIDGKRTRVMSAKSYEIFDDQIMVIDTILAVMKRLCQLTPEETKALRIFRNR